MESTETLPVIRPSRLPAVPRMEEDHHVARRLGVSQHAVALTRDAVVLDLHVDTFIPPRLWGYDPLLRHGGGPLGRHFFGHLDLYRNADGGMNGAMWSITTNPFRSTAGRWAAFRQNLRRMQALVERSRGHLAMARDATELDAVLARGAHAVLVAIQGGNAVQGAPRGLESIPDDLVVRATVVHLTNSDLGATSSPLHRLRSHKGLTELGRGFVQQCDARRVLVDLAHIHPQGFWDAVEVHDRTLPLIATHTGVCGVRPHWRNLDDRQVKAIADSGGTIGVIYAVPFLSRPGGPRDGRMILEHLEHVIRVGGEGAASLGSDYDGAISPPADLPSGACTPRLVQHMLDARWTEERVRAVLGGNFLRTLRAIRPGSGATA